MNDERRDEIGRPCPDCGTRSLDRGFPIGDDAVLCWDCAIRRGGQFDSDLDEWTTAPETSDVRRPWIPREP